MTKEKRKEEETSKPEVPFFARFLEGQDFPRVQTDVKAGRTYQTMKWPSDNDENPTS